MSDGPPDTDNAEAEATPPPCLSCHKPSTWTSPTGHRFCQACRDIFTDLFPQEGLQPVDLRSLMSGERPEEDWLIEPVLPAGKLVGIVSKRGDGKSLLLLDIAAAIACGQATLSQPAGDPIDVIYIDMEMGPDDLYERLADLGYLPDHPRFDLLADHLHYYQLIALPPLDTEAGGIALEELVERHHATLVVIDTVSRVVGGDENTAEPYKDLFRHTETRLKRRRVTLARLDHLGKDKERGSRGSSAKEDPLDVVWHLTITVTGAIELTLTKGRQGWLPRTVTIHKEEVAGGTFRHILPYEETPDWLAELVKRMDLLYIPVDTGVNKSLEALRAAGQGSHRRKVSQAVRFRKHRSGGSANPGTTQFRFQPEPLTPQTEPPPNNHINIDLPAEPPSGTSTELVVPDVYPPKRGTTSEPGGSEDNFDLDDFADFDPADLPNPYDEENP